MPDEAGYYSSAEKAAYRPGQCGECGSTLRVVWYPRRVLADQSNEAGLWSKSPDMCPTLDKH